MNPNENNCKKLRTSIIKIKSKKGQDHKKPEQPLWSQIPATVLLAIYTYLGDVDRVSMARVCKTWYRGFLAPALWRTRFIEFGGRRTEEEIEEEASMNSETATLMSYGKNAIKFVKQFPTSLQDIEINFRLISGRDAKVIVNDFKAFSASLDGVRLRNISIADLDVDRVSRTMQKDIADSLKSLLHNQRSLQKCRIAYSCFDLETGLQILECLAEASAATIEDLSLDGLFQNGLPIYREERVLKELQKFKGLSRINFDYNLICEELVKSWVTGCQKLSFIELYSGEYVHPSHVISCETWKSLVGTHPDLLVEYQASELQDTNQMLYILSPSIPLFKFRWYTFRPGTTESEMTRLLQRVAHYHRTIRHLSLFILGQFPNLDETAVQNTLSKCTNLLPIQCLNFTHSLTGENTWSLSNSSNGWLAQNDI